VTPVIASGGVSSLDDVKALKARADAMAQGTVEGAISGRAIYDGRLDLTEALKVLKA